MIGYCMSTCDEHEPFFVSPGHGITLAESIGVIKMIAGKSYLPNPLKAVHVYANRLAREHWKMVKRSKSCQG